MRKWIKAHPRASALWDKWLPWILTIALFAYFAVVLGLVALATGGYE